jgi:hypothetical protein
MVNVFPFRPWADIPSSIQLLLLYTITWSFISQFLMQPVNCHMQWTSLQCVEEYAVSWNKECQTLRGRRWDIFSSEVQLYECLCLCAEQRILSIAVGFLMSEYNTGFWMSNLLPSSGKRVERHVLCWGH